MIDKVNRKGIFTSGSFLFFGCIFSFHISAQQTDSSYKTVIPGAQYGTSAGHQKRWGKHYRKEWTTPVKLPILVLDTIAGGLTPYEAGGGRQSKSLRLRDAQGREWVLRSIDKTFGKALPEIYQNTFIEKIA